MTMRISDPDRRASLALQVWGYKQGEVVSLMIHLGDRLGLYQAMAGQGPTTAGGLAARTDLHERWLLEWLRGQAAAGLVDTTDGEVFELSPEAAEILADEEGSLWFAAGAFQGGMAPPDVVDRLADAFRTGQGLTLRRPRTVGRPRGGADAGALDATGAGTSNPAGARWGVRSAHEGWPRRRRRLRLRGGPADHGGGIPELPLRWIRSVASRHSPSPGPPGRDWPDQRRAPRGGGRRAPGSTNLRLDCHPRLHPRHAPPGRGDRRHPAGHWLPTAPGSSRTSGPGQPGATTSAIPCWP